MHYSVKRILKIAGIGLFFIYWLSACVFAADSIGIFVSIPPMKYLVERIGGNLVDVSVMVMPGADPHTYEPKPKQMVSLSAAKAYFAIGITFEDVWLPRFKAANPNMVVFHADENLEKIPINTNSFNSRSDHHHGPLDPHVWTAPPLVNTICRNIRNGMVKIDAAHHTIYKIRYRSFEKEINRIHGELKRMFEPKKGMSFMVYHPAWGYFAKTYGLNQIPIEIEGKKPKPAQLKHLIEYARHRGIKIIFVQPQVSDQNAKIIATAIDGEVVSADPLAYHWTENIRKTADIINSALK